MTRATRKGNLQRWNVFLGLTFLVALGLALLILWLYKPPQPSLPPQPGGGGASTDLPASLAGGPSARESYQLAVKVAEAWQPDGKLAVVLAHWQPREGHWPTDVIWLFQFYSAATHRLAVIIVDQERASLLRDVMSPYPVPTFGEDEWQVDSYAALDAWWQAGGATFSSFHSAVDLTAQLRISDEGDGPVWTVTGIVGEQVSQWIVDGATGEPVQEERSD